MDDKKSDEKTIVGLKYVDTPNDVFSGKANLRHGRSEYRNIWNNDASSRIKVRDMPSITEFSSKAPNDITRYDGSGGVLGGNGVYLDPNGNWTKPGEMGRWDVDTVYDVEANFKNAKILTPDTISSFQDGKYMSGDQLADLAKSKGHDGLVMSGFDADRAKFFKEVDANEPFSDLEWHERADEPKHDEWFRDEYVPASDKYGRFTEQAGIDEGVMQDQVMAFEPTNVEIKGKVDPTSKYKYTDMSPKTISNLKAGGLELGSMLLGHLISKAPDLRLDIKDAGEGSDSLPPEMQKEKNDVNLIRRQAMINSMKK